jgi:hypothetical protein
MNAVQLRESSNGLRQSEKPVRDILIVHELFAPGGQDVEFFQVIKGMAEQGRTWHKIIYVDSKTIDRLGTIAIEKGNVALRKEMCELLTIESADELYLSRDWQLGSQIFLEFFRSAFKICYGDGVGLYFPESYFYTKTPLTRLKFSTVGKVATSIAETFKNAIKFPARRPVFENLTNARFNFGYLLLANLSREKPSFPYSLITLEQLRQTLREFARDFTHPIIDRLANGSESPSILLTSNFSEAGRTSVESEISLYSEFLGGQEKCNLLIIKPHPRDDKKKLLQLKRVFIDKGHDVVLLDDQVSFYTPFEFFLLQIESRSPGAVKRMSFFTTSSSCLTIALLFNCKPHLGFGDQLVNRYFFPKYRKGRISHELDLNNVLSKSKLNETAMVKSATV